MSITSGGYYLVVPPTPLTHAPRFVAIDDVSGIFLSVEYDPGNTTSWTQLQLHTVDSPAIVFPTPINEEHERNKGKRLDAFLVSVESRTDDGTLDAKLLGKVKIAQFPQHIINWDVLASTKQPELVEELRRGLLRAMFDNGQHVPPSEWVFATPASILRAMPRRWDQDAGVLNEEMDRLFAAVLRIPSSQQWRLYD